MPKVSPPPPSRQDAFGPVSKPSENTLWITSDAVTVWCRQQKFAREREFEASEADGICIECMNPRTEKHVFCTDCAALMTEAELVEYLIPSLKEEWDEQQAERAEEIARNNREIEETEYSLRAGAV